MQDCARDMLVLVRADDIHAEQSELPEKYFVETVQASIKQCVGGPLYITDREKWNATLWLLSAAPMLMVYLTRRNKVATQSALQYSLTITRLGCWTPTRNRVSFPNVFSLPAIILK